MSRIASNFITLDKVKDKDIINKLEKEHQEELKNINYAIDLNTGKVKQNNHYAIYITEEKNKDIIHIDKTLNKDLKDIYILKMEHFNKGLNIYKDLDNYKVIMYDKVDNKKIDKLTPKEKEQYILENYTSKLDNKDAINQLIVQFNKFYDSEYLNGFNFRARDLLNVEIKKEYVKQLASAYTQVQVSDIEKIGQIKWLNSDLDTIKDFKFSLDKDILKNIQKELLEIKDDLSDDDTIKLSELIYNANLDRFTNEIDTYIDEDKEYYKKVHKLYQEIDKKIIDIIDNINNKLDSIVGSSIVKVKHQIKTPTINSMPLDFLKLFNNLYPNYKYKSIDDDRHKDIDVKAELMFDLDTSVVNDFEDLRLLNFMRDDNIRLFPIQASIINAFTDIRDINGADKCVPLLSVLKHKTENSSLRLPSRVKDLELYDDYMLFFRRCKIIFKIIDKKTKKVIFELKRPMPILENTPYEGKDYEHGYIIGNSVINVFKNKLDEIYDTPRITSHLTSKKYLKTSKPSTPPMQNIVDYIYPEIAKKINYYKYNGKYNSLINITTLYEYQEWYESFLGNKIEKKKIYQKTRDNLNSYLDDLVKYGLITSYKDMPPKNKIITTYSVEINKDAKI